MKLLIFACAALFIFTCVRDAQAYPHTDKPGYHHCPESAKLTHRCEESGASHRSGTFNLAEGNVIRQGIEDNDAGRRHRPHDQADRESFRMVDDFYAWLHSSDRHALRVQRRRHRADRCRHLHELYIFRHGLRGPERNDCRGWQRDAHWHERHPAELSTFLGVGV